MTFTDATDAVAIIGLDGRFPGASDPETLWENLRAGLTSITDFTPEQIEDGGTDPAEAARPDHVPAKGFLAGADRFDAAGFGFTRAEAAILDPQHRLLLETARAAVEDAGYSAGRTAGRRLERTGVYVGGSPTEHALACQTDPALAGEIGGLSVRTLTDREFLAPWVSYRLGLDGPSLTVQTACSTSLVAVHLAVQALLLGECDAALVAFCGSVITACK